MRRIATARLRRGQVFDVVTASQQTLVVEAGAQDADAAGPGPMELMLVSVATCAGATLAEILEKMRRPVDDLRVVVQGERAPEPPRIWTRVALTYLVRGEIAPDRLHRAAHLADRTCSASNMIARVAELESAVIQVCRVGPEQTRPLRQRLLRPHQSLDELVVPGEDDPVAAWFAALHRDEVVATAGIFPEQSPDHPDLASSWRLRSMATADELQGMGLGAMLLDACLDHAKRRDGTVVWCSARVPARGFYEAAGFEATSEEWDEPNIGPHLRMARTLD